MSKHVTLPPFDPGVFFCLAYVSGRYGLRTYRHRPRGFHALYLTKAEGWPRFCFKSFARDGKHLSYHAVTGRDISVEFALIEAFIKEAIPFDQWRLFPIGEAERDLLRRRKTLRFYDATRQALARTMRLVRLPTMYHKIDWKGARIFEVQPRPAKAIRADKAEYEEIWRLVRAGLD